jgi:dihydroorotate dehydrogenase electron transfer subunit
VDAEVVSNEAEGPGSGRLVLRVEEGWPETQPGQFLMLSPGTRGRVDRYDPLLPRPMAIFRTHRKGGEAAVEVLYKVVGRGTALLADARAGERVILVGGGTGIASLFDLARHSSKRAQVVVLLSKWISRCPPTTEAKGPGGS